MNRDPIDIKNPGDLMPYSNETKIKPARGDKEDETKDEDDLKESSIPKRGLTSKMGKITDSSPKMNTVNVVRKNFYTKYLERSDVIEIALGLLEYEDVFKLVNVLYDDLTEPIPSNYKLFKLLIQTEHMDLFEL